MAEINQYRQGLARKESSPMPCLNFIKRGVKAVKMDEISHGLHVSKSTVYEIFGDKEELLLAGMMRQHGRRQSLEVREFRQDPSEECDRYYQLCL